MKKFWNNPVIAFLASLKLSAALMVLAAFASAKATFIESDFGRDAAYDLIYAARWFEGILALLVISLTLLFFKRWPYKGRQTGFMLLHLSIIIILVSSAMTRYMGFEGTMRIREGESTDFYYSEKPHIRAEIDGQAASFPVRLWRPGENSAWRDIRLGGQDYELGVTEYWPRYAESWQPGEGGTPALQFGRTGDGEVKNDMLLMGDHTTIGRAQVHYRTDAFSGEISLSQYGDLRVHIAGEHLNVPVGLPDGSQHGVGGYAFEITEFQTAFKVGGGSNADGPLTNPMIRVAITGPDGTTGERLLFALHPDFSMGHSGGQEQFAELDLLYQVSSGCEFAPGGATGLEGRATFALQTIHMTSEERGEIAAGEVFPVTPEMLYVNDAEGFSFVAARIHDSVVKQPALSTDANAPSAARLVIRDAEGNEAQAIVHKYGRGESVSLGGRAISLSFAPVAKKLPYSLRLDDFVLETYPGSDNPATYESFVSVEDPGQQVSGKKAHIYMNHPLTYRGTKHFQSSYDMDRRGTVLSLNKDPGKWPTYFGYTLLTIGFILIMVKDLIWRRKPNGAAVKAAVLALTILTAAGTLLPAVTAQAQTGHEGHDHGPVPDFVVLSDPAREAASRLIIQDFRGRMKPLDTQAREMVMKVARKTKFQDRHPVDMYLNWTANATYWWNQPCIGVRHGGLKDLLGVDDSVKHVSPASLYDEKGNYRLSKAVEEAHRTPDRERSKTQRKLISFDERFHLLYMTFQGQDLRMFPVPGDENDTWVDVQSLQGKVDEATSAAYTAAFQELTGGMHTGDNGAVLRGLRAIDGFQKQYGAEVLPTDLQLKAELTYNQAHIFSWMMVPLLIAFAILMPLYIWNLFRTRENVGMAIKTLTGINHNVLVAGLGLLSVGTLLGGVWANESWGRYWGWDAKETWSLITILAYAVVLHFRWIPQIRSSWLSASGSLAAIGSVVMTYFGVNYFLAGLHSYAQGDAATVPDWVFIFSGAVVLLIIVSGLVQLNRWLISKYGEEKARTRGMPLMQVYFSLKGRLPRPTALSWFVLPVSALSTIAILLDTITDLGGNIPWGGVLGIVTLVTLYPAIAVTSKRLQDQNVSGWFALLTVVPLVNIWVLIRVIGYRGTIGQNRFGPDPVPGGEKEPLPAAPAREASNEGARLSFRNPFYSLGMALYAFAFAGMIYGYVLRWIASGRAPLSNGHESLLFISLSVVLAGLLFELAYRMAAPAGLAALLTVVILGVSMLSVFDPEIGPLVPVLVSYWLNIHVTVITSSYGFLGLSALIGALVLILLTLPASRPRADGAAPK